jgi:hypothetical protein
MDAGAPEQTTKEDLTFDFELFPGCVITFPLRVLKVISGDIDEFRRVLLWRTRCMRTAGQGRGDDIYELVNGRSVYPKYITIRKTHVHGPTFIRILDWEWQIPYEIQEYLTAMSCCGATIDMLRRERGFCYCDEQLQSKRYHIDFSNFVAFVNLHVIRPILCPDLLSAEEKATLELLIKKSTI